MAISAPRLNAFQQKLSDRRGNPRRRCSLHALRGPTHAQALTCSASPSPGPTCSCLLRRLRWLRRRRASDGPCTFALSPERLANFRLRMPTSAESLFECAFFSQIDAAPACALGREQMFGSEGSQNVWLPWQRPHSSGVGAEDRPSCRCWRAALLGKRRSDGA